MTIGVDRKKDTFHSFIFKFAFPLGRIVAAAAALRGSTSQFRQPLIVMLTLHQDRIKQGQRCNHATWSIVDLWAVFLMGIASRTCLADLAWDILFTWTNWRFSVGYSEERCLHIQGVTNFTAAHFAANCHVIYSSQKSHLSRLYFRQHPFSHIRHKIHDHRWGSEQIPIQKLTALQCKTAPALWPLYEKAHAELHLLYQPVYQSPCSAFSYSWGGLLALTGVLEQQRCEQPPQPWYF